MTRAQIILGSLGLAGVALASHARDLRGPVVMVDWEMKEQQVEIVSVTREFVRFRAQGASAGPVSAMPREEVAAIIGVAPPRDSSTLLYRGSLSLIDGQRLVGSPALSDFETPPESVVWTHDRFGTQTFLIERLSSIVTSRLGSPPPAAPDSVDEDTITFTNGDVARGFVTGVSDALSWEEDGVDRSLRVDFAARVDFANPPEPASGTMVWLGDGSAVRVLDLLIDSDHLGSGLLDAGQHTSSKSSAPDDEQTSSDERDRVENLRPYAIVFEAERVLPLTVESAAEASGAVQMGTLDADDRALAPDVLVPGPMALEWTLPASAERVGFVVELPRRSRAWGRPIVTVETGDRQRTRVQLSAETRSIPIVLGLNETDTDLTITVEASQAAAVQDSVILRRPVVFLAPGG